MSDDVVQTAESVLRILGKWRLPVDPFEIARIEGISLAPGDYGTGFDARIEYFSSLRKFGIFYRQTERSLGRIRFSVAHELGHYYLPSHRQRLVSGTVHNSKSNFSSRDPIENEADRFAANLLMPRPLFIEGVKRFRQSVCTLKELMQLADRFETSVTSTAIRYCDCDIEPAIAIFSINGVVQWSWHSYDMRSLGCSFVAAGSQIPSESVTAQLVGRRPDVSHPQIVSGRVPAHEWFERPNCDSLYEEATTLGNRVLTWIAIDS